MAPPMEGASMPKRTTLILTLSILLAAAIAPGQEKGAPPPVRPQTALQVKIVLARQPAGKPVTRLPYTMACLADNRRTSLRMGVEVPVPVNDGKGFQYRSVGTNITCEATSVGDGAYRVGLEVEQSSIGDAPTGGNPTFQTFNSTFATVLRDGQGGVHAVATDPVTGQESTIEVSLKVMK
jgi:hypothetical protein